MPVHAVKKSPISIKEIDLKATVSEDLAGNHSLTTSVTVETIVPEN